MTERLISADSHVRVAHEQVKQHLSARYHDAYDTAVAAFTDRMARGPGAANQQWQKRKAAEGNAAFTRPGYWDPAERLKDMDEDGVEVEVIYSEVSAFRYLGEITEGQDDSVRAFNDVLHGFASADPKRLVVSYQIPIHDIDAAVDEVHWAASVGCKSLQLPVFPAELGLADYWEQRYASLWAAIQETHLPICCHIGMNTQLDDLARRDPTPQKGIFVPMVPLSAAEALGMWIMGGVFEQFPDLKVVFVEPGLGWVSWWLYIVDDMMTRQGYEFPAISELPSEYFRRNVYLTFIDEPDAIRHAHERLGIENIMWSSDYPHPVSSWPNSRKLVEQMFEGVPQHERELVVSGNAARVWNL
jgi:predicted TIM-barrel fold metal-dependent hydrolase